MIRISSTRLLSHLPLTLTKPGQKALLHRLSHQDESHLKDLLAKYIDLDFAEEIVQDGKSSIRSRHEGAPPSQAGLLAIAAYTSCQLSPIIKTARKQIEEGQANKLTTDITQLEQLIKNTVLLIRPTPVPVVRKNKTIDIKTLENYRPSKLIEIDELTAVTLHTHQVHKHGNVDLIYTPPPEGVVDVSKLSIHDGRFSVNEHEGQLDHGTVYQSVRNAAGKEQQTDKAQQLDPENFPLLTVELKFTGRVGTVGLPSP